MAYRALYREYRPVRFSDMVGQDHITSVLKNQIATNKTTHAYLLCGTRGTGKTTAARILARAINCLEPVNGEACGHCEACRFSMSENCPDIVEIDAASNNGVENVRELIETCNIAPLKLQKRVVIIDEVHMLSASAFNALLKTLEEPPAHLVFILATTEPHKLLATIVSRCQRFDFHRISIPDILKNLKSILHKIGATVEDEGLLQIARSANGGMRDALSLLDQCLSFCGDHLSTEDVYNVLGNMEESYMLSIGQSLLDCNPAKAIYELDAVVQKGRDLNIFVNDLADLFRSFLVIKTCAKDARDILDHSEDTLKKYSAAIESASNAQLLMAMRLLLELQSSIKYSPAPRTLIETAFIRIAKPEKQHSMEALEARIDLLEKKLAEGTFNVTAPKEQTRANIPADYAVPVEVMPCSALVGASAYCEDPLPAPSTEIQSVQESVSAHKTPEAVPQKEEVVSVAGESDAEPAAPIAPAAAESCARPLQQQSASAPDDCFSIWKSLLSMILREVPIAAPLASKGVPLNFENNLLTVGFTEENKMCLATVSAPRISQKINVVMDSMIPGATVVFTKYSPQPLDSHTEQKLKDMFGDKLVITND